MAGRIESIVDRGLCLGCGVCLAETPATGQNRMALDASGFLRPQFKVRLTDEEDRAAAERCPGISLRAQNNDGSPVHPVWGPVQATRVGWATDPEVRHRGSSGGAISGLLIDLLESGQVDGVVHVAASDNAPLRVERVMSRNRADVIRAAGSRYAPAAPLAHLAELMEGGDRIAFVGKPCDIGALRGYLRQHPEFSANVKLMVSFMCAGVPSMHGTYALLKELGTTHEEVVRFQYRGDGWPGYATAWTRMGQVLRMDYNNSWGRVLGPTLQLRCKLCPDGTGELADVVCADAWHGKDGYPSFEEQDGRSLILSRTQAGERALQAAASRQRLVMEGIDAAEIAKMQPYQLTRKQVVLGRWLAVWARGKGRPTFQGLHLWAALRTGGFVQALRHAWGTYRRLLGTPAQRS